MKAIISFFLVFGLMIGAHADIISVEQAQSIAQNFLAQRNKTAVLAQPAPSVRSKSFHTSEADDYYVFNADSNNGFVIVAGADNVPSILGYSDTGSFSYDDLPPGLETMLRQYSDMVSYAKSHDCNPIVSATHPVIKPMITAKWGQSDPFNQSCPNFVTGSKAVVGCIAVAMGQIMHYHGAKNYKFTQAEIPSYYCKTMWGGYGKITVKSVPNGTAILWNEMPDDFKGSVYTLQKKAVANLLFYCGAAVKMEYGDHDNGGSWAYNNDIPNALIKYFGYKSGVRLVYKQYYGTTQWDDLIYNELANNRPVIMSGRNSVDGGHAFICDGYDGNSRYHINWGWDGDCDGYFLLGNLAPEYYPNGFNGDVCAIIGITPPAPSDVNQDNKVNSADVIGVYNYIEYEAYTGYSLETFDVNRDKSVNGTDVVAIYNDIAGGASSEAGKVFDGVVATGNAYYTYPSYCDKVTIKNNLSKTVSLNSIDLYRDGNYCGTYTLGRTLSPGQSLTVGPFKITIQYVGTHTTKLKYFYQGETYEKLIDTPSVYVQ